MRRNQTRENIVGFISRFKEDKGYAPTVKEIAEQCGISSLSVVQYHLDHLEGAGIIKRDRNKARSISIEKMPQEHLIPLLGIIAAGHPIGVPDAETWNTATEWIEAPVVSRGAKNIYALRVRGNSMVDALIADGDIAIMQQTHDIRNGDVVACWLKDQQEVTLKKIYFEGDNVRLQPCNPYMMPIYAKAENVEVQGKLIGTMRTYSSSSPDAHTAGGS